MTGKSFPFQAFVDYIERIAKDNKWKPEKIAELHEGIVKKGGSFSLIEDGGLDSLDVVELIMKLEEFMDEDGYDHKGIEGPEFDNAKDIGDFYRAICKKAGFAADSDLSVAA